MSRAQSSRLDRVDAQQTRRPTEPLGGTVRFIAMLFALLVAMAIVLSLTGHNSWSFGGFGQYPVCVTEPHEGIESSDWTLREPDFAAKAGATVNVAGNAQACAQHPSLSQRTLDTLTSVPATFVWLGTLFLLWRLVRSAERYGPFTMRTARLLRFIGWFVIAGSILATAASGAATDALLNTMLKAGHSYADAIPGLGAQPAPLLAGIAALTFARIVRVGVRMDEDLQGTV